MITLEDLNEDKMKEGMTTHKLITEIDHGKHLDLVKAAKEKDLLIDGEKKGERNESNS